MIVYWLLFAYFAFGAIISGPPGAIEKRGSVLFVVGALLISLIVGLRFKVGGDWASYQFIYDRAGEMTFSEALSIGDPAYQAVNWITYQLGARIWLANTVCAAIFAWGLSRFCRIQPSPWIAAAVAIPYMVIVIAMGYTRQAVALGLMMAGVAGFLRGDTVVRFAAYVAAAALFHKTAVVALPLVGLASERNRFVNVLIVAGASVLFYDAFLGDAMDHFVQNYVRTPYSSQGAMIRVSMNVLAAVSLWLGRRKFDFTGIERKVWNNFAIASLGSLALFTIMPSSTAIDRISLYLIPIQIAVFSRIPHLFKSKAVGIAAVLAYCFAVEFTWLNYAQFSSAWVPYSFYPIG